MNKVPKESIETSRVMSSSSISLLSHNPKVKVTLPKLEISKFDGDIINLTVILLIFEDFGINLTQLYIQMTVLMI